MARQTPLNHIFAVFGLKSRAVVETVREIAADMHLSSGISRQHLVRLRAGRAKAGEAKMFLLVAAIRHLTGVAVRASDLFAVEPPMDVGAVRFSPDLRAYGSVHLLPVCSTGPASVIRRDFVLEPPGESGDAAFERLYAEYGLLLRTIATRRYGIPPGDAEALVHDSFIAYLERHTQIRDVKLWLIGAVSNACKHYWRDRKREAPLPADIDEAADPASPASIDGWEWRITVGKLVSRLGEKCRETLHRYYWREESKEKIAETLSTSPAYVLQLLVTCRRRMRELLQAVRMRKP